MPRPLALPLWFSISISLWACRRTPREWSERHLVANTQAKIGQWKNTLEQYALIDAVVEKWPETSKMRVIYTPTRVLALLHTTDHDRALDTAEKYHKYVRSLLGDQHRDTALAEGYLAVAKTHKGATEAALEHFKSAAAILAASASGTDDDEAAGPSNFEADRRYILENYIAVLARARDAD